MGEIAQYYAHQEPQGGFEMSHIGFHTELRPDKPVVTWYYKDFEFKGELSPVLEVSVLVKCPHSGYHVPLKGVYRVKNPKKIGTPKAKVKHVEWIAKPYRFVVDEALGKTLKSAVESAVRDENRSWSV